jgi:hypothetical protein
MGFRYIFYFFLIISAPVWVVGQENLVSNPGFEGDPLLPDSTANGHLRASIREYKKTHPGASADNISSAFGLFPLEIPNTSYSQGKPGDMLVQGWFQPTLGTTDYWNTNTSYPGSDPFPSSPRQGGKMGMVFSITPEYIETRLTEPLEAGRSYYVEFYIHPPKTASIQALSSLGALFTKDSLITQRGGYIQAQPQVLVCDTVVLNDQAHWRKISGCFTAKGGEQFLTIGCFDFYEAMGIRKKFEPFFAKQTRFGSPQEINKFQNGYGDLWYYLVDDVLVTEDEDCEHFEAESENITFLVDVSASMHRGGFMDALKQDIEAFLLGVGKNTEVSILSFAAQVKILTSHTKLTDESKLSTLLDSLVPGGKTNIQEAIGKAYQIAGQVKDTTLENRMILLTDAAFDLDESTIHIIQEGFLKRNIRLQVFHYGTEKNEKLDRMITKNGGEYHSSSGESLQKVLVNQVDCPCKLK